MQFQIFRYRLKNETPNREIDSILGSISEVNLPIGKGFALILRKSVIEILQSKGWSAKVRLHQISQISITAIKGDTGLCLQTGNVSRVYADLLKLQYLFLHKVILSSVYILPSKTLADEVGSNAANFERMKKELELFYEIVTIPILMIGLERE